MTGRITYRGLRLQSGSEVNRYRAHWDGVPDHRIDRARRGVNPLCVECYGKPLDGGLRCLACFGKIARPKAPSGCGTDAGYTAHLRRGETPCRSCIRGHRVARIRRETRVVA